MESSPLPCDVIPTTAEKSWTYHEYYIGERDDDKRRSGKGENHWSGATLKQKKEVAADHPDHLRTVPTSRTGAGAGKWYHGCLMRDTMHGLGKYRWRFLGREGTHFTYEGHFHCNRMHGYGAMSYPDGKTFTGLFHSNIRWGPGIESQACLKQDVGLWRGTQLIRLTWRPETPSVAPDLCANPGTHALVSPHRVLLSSRCRTIGKMNSAIDLLKQCGSEPLSATERWNKLYPKNCTDLASLLCHTEVFEREYHKGKMKLLEEVNDWNEVEQDTSEDSDDEMNPGSNNYYAWNNNKVTVHMMKHSFMHDKQRNIGEIDLTAILSGPRQHFKSAGKHEIDCRTLLMGSFLGHIQNVVQLINEHGIYPDVADSQGNTAVMYATCGDRTEIIHFLVEAGANIDSYNDSCCTPLAVALLRLACVQKDIPPSGMVQALLPPPTSPSSPTEEHKVFEWCIERSDATQYATGPPPKLPKVVSEKKLKGQVSTKDLTVNGKKIIENASITSPGTHESSSDESFTDYRIYYNMNDEFETQISDLYSCPTKINPMPYLFEVCDMIKYVDIPDEEPKKVLEKGAKGVPSKLMKDQSRTVKPSKEKLWQSDKDDSSLNSVEKQKEERLAQITITILQLLTDGANPKLVRCPQPAIFTAIVSRQTKLIKHLVNCGADINEEYPSTFGYTPLDISVSLGLSNETDEVVRTVLECGGLPNHRLRYGELEKYGPTLLHAVLAKKPENYNQEEVQISLLELLLDYNCNPLIQFKGRSAVDVALTKNIYLLRVFIENSTTNLNAAINEANQTLLVKLFYMPFFKTLADAERLQILTHLLLFGADPLLECQNGDEKFPNLFVYMKKTLTDLEIVLPPKPVSGSTTSKTAKEDSKKPKKDQSSKSTGKFASDDVGDYKQAMDLVVECARLLHERWLQAKLTKDLVEIIEKYKHRQWNMVMKEHKHKKGVRMWLTVQRCLEIWDIMKSTKKKTYNDNRILKYLLYIVTFYNSKTKVLVSTKLTADEKYSIELSVGRLLKERKMAFKLPPAPLKRRPYVKPELTPKADESKFKVCFECALPFGEEKIECRSCKCVSFCSLDCLRINVDRANCHPCSDYLKQKFFPTSPGTESDIFINIK